MGHAETKLPINYAIMIFASDAFKLLAIKIIQFRPFLFFYFPIDDYYFIMIYGPLKNNRKLA
jgi:hypothetical protein